MTDPAKFSPGPLPGNDPAAIPLGGGVGRVRYPLDPLFDAMRLSPHQACVVLGLSGSTQKEYRARGVTEKVADRLAVKAGLSPYEVWPEMVDHQIAAIERACARTDCDQLFVPAGRRIYCSDACGQVVRERRRRQRPEVREANRAYAATYYARNRAEVRRAQQSARQAARRRQRAADAPLDAQEAC